MDRTTYEPEAEEAARRLEGARVAREGAIIWRARQMDRLRQKQLEQAELRRTLANYWPWGRPGGGAPCAPALRKRNVPLEPSLSQQTAPLPQVSRAMSMAEARMMNRSPDISDIYKSYLHYSPTTALGPERIHPQPAAPAANLQPGRHVAAATQPGYIIDSWRVSNRGNRDYVNQLAEQIRYKQERAMEERRRDGDNCRRHFATWQRLWGKPGHGAPVDSARRRNNLYEILHRTPAMH